MAAINTQDIVQCVKQDIGETHVISSVVRDVQQGLVEKKMDIVLRVLTISGAICVTSNALLTAKTPAFKTQDFVRSVKPDTGDTRVINSVIRIAYQIHVTRTLAVQCVFLGFGAISVQRFVRQSVKARVTKPLETV